MRGAGQSVFEHNSAMGTDLMREIQVGPLSQERFESELFSSPELDAAFTGSITIEYTVAPAVPSRACFFPFLEHIFTHRSPTL